MPSLTMVVDEGSKETPRAVPESIDRGTKGIEHGAVEIGERSPLLANQVLTGLELSTSVTSDNDREIAWAMAVAIAKTGTKEDHGLIEHIAVAFGHVTEFL